jgi:hypothetical protein
VVVRGVNAGTNVDAVQQPAQFPAGHGDVKRTSTTAKQPLKSR